MMALPLQPPRAQECSICLEQIEPVHSFTVHQGESNGHTFDIFCLHVLLQTSSYVRCPLCRKQIEEKDKDELNGRIGAALREFFAAAKANIGEIGQEYKPYARVTEPRQKIKIPNLWIIARAGNRTLLRYYLQKQKNWQQDLDDALSIAAQKGHKEIVKELCLHPVSQLGRKNAALQAAEHEHIEIARDLFSSIEQQYPGAAIEHAVSGALERGEREILRNLLLIGPISQSFQEYLINDEMERERLRHYNRGYHECDELFELFLMVLRAGPIPENSFPKWIQDMVRFWRL